MTAPKKIIDSIFLLIIGVASIFSLYMHFANNYSLTINYYLGLLLWVLAMFFKLKRFKKEFFGTLILLVLSTFNCINFTIYTINAPIHHINSSLSYSGMGINNLAFLLLIAYCIINKSMISAIYRKIFRESEKEQDVKRDKLITFYYRKFIDCDKAEFENLYKNYNSYPVEAQEALILVKTKKHF